jgi:predicted RNA-binding protein
VQTSSLPLDQEFSLIANNQPLKSKVFAPSYWFAVEDKIYFATAENNLMMIEILGSKKAVWIDMETMKIDFTKLASPTKFEGLTIQN